jgi:putative transposase
MLDLSTLFGCLASAVEPTTLRQWSRIVAALLAMTGRVTRRGIARWSDQGGR